MAPSEDTQRPVPISVILQNARVIEVGTFSPRLPAQPPTPTPAPDEPTPTPDPAPPTPTPEPPNVLLLALPPQQQLFLDYALEVTADIDLAMRRVNDAQLYAVQNVDINYLLQQFNITVPPNTELYDWRPGNDLPGIGRSSIGRDGAVIGEMTVARHMLIMRNAGVSAKLRSSAR